MTNKPPNTILPHGTIEDRRKPYRGNRRRRPWVPCRSRRGRKK